MIGIRKRRILEIQGCSSGRLGAEISVISLFICLTFAIASLTTPLIGRFPSLVKRNLIGLRQCVLAVDCIPTEVLFDAIMCLESRIPLRGLRQRHVTLVPLPFFTPIDCMPVALTVNRKNCQEARQISKAEAGYGRRHAGGGGEVRGPEGCASRCFFGGVNRGVGTSPFYVGVWGGVGVWPLGSWVGRERNGAGITRPKSPPWSNLGKRSAASLRLSPSPRKTPSVTPRCSASPSQRLPPPTCWAAMTCSTRRPISLASRPQSGRPG